MSFLLGLGFALVLMPLALRLGVRTGLVDRPGSLKIHPRPISVVGGPAVIAASVAASALVDGGFTHLGAAAVAIAVGTGLLDDLRPVRPIARVIALGGAGLVLAWGGVTGVRVGALEVLGVTALVLACTNATNLMDGQDMLAGGLAAMAAAVLGFLLNGSGGHSSGLGFALAGALVAFLLWNRPPARIFLGNGGAYGVGVLLAQLAASNVARAGWSGLLSSGACLGVFGLELGITIVRRMASRRPLSVGDRAHSYDVIADRFGGRQRSTLALWSLGVAGGCLALLLNALPLAAAAGVAALSAVAVAIGAFVLMTGELGRTR